MIDASTLLRQLFSTAVEAVSPRNCTGDIVSDLYERDALVIGAGKAAAAMAVELENRWLGQLDGLVIVPYGHSTACRSVEVVEAAHPVPDVAGVQATERLVSLANRATAGDTVICLLSGGGSSLLTAPATGISLLDKQSLTSQLLSSGASIEQINCVRKHLSAIKGGALARACAPAELITLVISDVPGNDLSVIASGPTVADTTTAQDALAILSRYEIETPETVSSLLATSIAPGPLPQEPRVHVLATADDALVAAADAARALGIEPLILGDLEGDACELAAEHAKLALKIANGNGPVRAPAVLLSGGETTVCVRGDGRGGRNGEYALSLALELDGHPAIAAIACDTDGIDGNGDNAGCFVAPDSLSRALALSIDACAMQANNDSYHFFAALDDLIITGPTLTNVNDFRAIFVAGVETVRH
jgi:hydroxypyruvate reductase